MSEELLLDDDLAGGLGADRSNCVPESTRGARVGELDPTLAPP
jgi:hypothetical protein